MMVSNLIGTILIQNKSQTFIITANAFEKTIGNIEKA